MKHLRSFIGTMVCVGLLVTLAGSPAYASPPFDPPALDRAIAAQEGHNADLLGIQGVVGTAVGLGADGNPVVKIFTEMAGIQGLPGLLDGVPVVVQITGKLFALHHACGHDGGPPGSEPFPCEEPPPPPLDDPPADCSTTDVCPRPVPIGVSTGNEGACSAGTIGARVTNGTHVFALSNNHVYALENDAAVNSNVLQPGRFDTNCAIDLNDVIGTLYDVVPIIFSTSANNEVDAAIALSSTALLGNSTPADGYGTPKSISISTSIGQRVQKYGRTTGLTTGQITDINAMLNIGYSSGTALFINQIVVQSTKPVIKAGDSGSLLVTDPEREPVGLLFAGNRSGKFAIANQIDLVLDAFGVTIDGE